MKKLGERVISFNATFATTVLQRSWIDHLVISDTSKSPASAIVVLVSAPNCHIMYMPFSEIVVDITPDITENFFRNLLPPRL